MVQIPSGLPVNNQNFTAATSSGQRNWAIGAILSATVTGPTVDNLLPLRIGGLDATAQTGLTLQPGTQLRLQVVANKPTLILRVLSEPDVTRESPVAAALRQALPRQSGLPPLLANINWLASQNPQQLPTAMRELATSAQQLLTQLSNPSDLAKPSGLQKAVIDSGIFLESKLAAPNSTTLILQGDLKAGFLRLQQLANTNPALPARSVAAMNPGVRNPVLSELANVRWLATQPQEQISQQLQPLAQLSRLLLAQLSGLQLSATNRAMVIKSSLYLESKLQSVSYRTLPLPANLKSTLLKSILATLRPVSQLLSTPGNNIPSGTTQLSSANTNPSVKTATATAVTDAELTSTTTTKLPGTVNNTAPAPPQRGVAVSAQPLAAADLPMIANIGVQIDHLRKQLEGALSRIQLHQLASLPTSAEAANRTWIFELPIRYQDTTQLMHVSIDADESGSNGTELQHTWTANLAFDLPELGAVHARISLRGEQLSTIFWAPSKTTAAHFQAALPTLSERLTAAGFIAPRVQALRGIPPRPTPSPTTTQQRLIDLST